MMEYTLPTSLYSSFNMYNVYEHYSSAMFVYFNCLSIVQEHLSSSLPSLYHPPPLLPFLSLLPFTPPSFLVRFPSSFPVYHSFFSYPSTSSNLSISSYLLFPSSSPLFFLIPPFLARLLPVQPLISFRFLH